MAKITTSTEVNASELAAILGITARRIRQLVEDGVIQKKKAKFSLCSAVQDYIRFSSKEMNMDNAKIEQTKNAAEAKLKASKATIAALEADEVKGKMHRAEDVRAITEDMIFSIRHGLMSLPGRLAVDTAAATTAAETSDLITREVHKVMGELANYEYDPDRYEERVRERLDWEAKQEIEDDD